MGFFGSSISKEEKAEYQAAKAAGELGPKRQVMPTKEDWKRCGREVRQVVRDEMKKGRG